MTGYEKIKRLAKEKRCKVTDLLVLAQKMILSTPAPPPKKQWLNGLPNYGVVLATRPAFIYEEYTIN